MKRLILTLFLAIGTLFTQAQVSWCDSLSYTAVPGTQLLTLVGNSSLSPNMVDSITWSWAVCDTNMCYSSVGDTAYFQMIQTTDTVKVCYDAYICFMGATYICMDCDSLVYNPNSYQWELMSAQPVGIKELIVDKINDGKMYDLLGRELFEVSTGTIYIKNRKKYIR